MRSGEKDERNRMVGVLGSTLAQTGEKIITTKSKAQKSERVQIMEIV